MIIEISCTLLIVLFVYAATSKLIDVEKFRIELGKSPLITKFASAVSVFVPGVEILISILLCFEKTRYFALNASFFMMVLFTSYLVAILRFSFYIPCTCGGVLQSMNWDQHILFNSFFIVLAGVSALIYPAKEKKNLKTLLQ